jgi:N-acetylglucosamine-6-phosphate deacetylase
VRSGASRWGNEALHKQGANANAGHSEALYHEISESIAWGVNHVTHLYCAMTDAMNNRWRGTPNPRAAGIVGGGVSG